MATFCPVFNISASDDIKFAENVTASRKHVDASLVKISRVLVRRFRSYRQSKFKKKFSGKNGNPLSQNGFLSGTGHPI
jgi:hypothetical protein